ncbi:hypothetical protein F2P56_005535 [Juglans regia]|uniref:FRIGIDA-like protein n=2 Tax=Juglans regia TaxID=51240 RepID=A0A2I4DZV0_JUGRE|nr:FRIGIDA-like protein 1 [Juglans regia]KAF5479024.1 hypothetical protein F2P56_005535 [Juglans regia]
MATLNAISAALKLIDVKKDDLKKAFDELQSHSSLLSSFSLSWSDLDAHFTSRQNSLVHRFHLLESVESREQNQPHATESTQPNPTTDPSSSQAQCARTTSEEPSSSSPPQTQTTQIRVDVDPDMDSDSLTPPRPELKALCEKMDGKELRKFISKRPKERCAIRAELPGAMRCAADPAAMVLDALYGFYSGNSVKLRFKEDVELGRLRWSCVLLLETLIGIKASVGVEVRERAKKLSLEWKAKEVEWKGKASPNEVQMFEVLALVHLVAAYGLRSEFNVDELVDYFVIIARFRQAVELCQITGLGHKVADIIHKLISREKQNLAVKFIFEFELSEKFPPVPLLKAYLNDVKKLANKVSKEGNESRMALNEAAAREVGAIKSVIKVIESHNLDSEYPRANLEKRIEVLEKLIANRKRPAQTHPMKPQQPQQQEPKKQKKHLQPKKEQQQQSQSKRPRTAALVDNAAVPLVVGGVSSTIHQYQQPHIQVTGLLRDCSAPYVSSSAAPYGMVGQTPTIAPYMGSPGRQYGFPGSPVGFTGNPSLAGSRLYSSEPYLTSGYYDRPTAHGGYDVPPEYHPSYYPR